MKKAMTIVYKVHNNLYVNLTNRCSCSCVFCLRQNRDHMEESDSLWLDHEPTLQEVKDAFAKEDMSQYEEVVFCGFGEPTERMDLLLEVATFVKENYQANLINGRDVAPELKGLVDTISISLNTPNEEKYNEMVRSIYGDKAYGAMLDFAREAKKYVPNVVLSTVDTTLSKEEEEQCRQICEKLAVTYRIRPWED